MSVSYIPEQVKRVLQRLLATSGNSSVQPETFNHSTASQDPLGDQLELRRFLDQNAKGGEYLRLYADVEAAGIDPVEHWLNHGLDEGREFPGIEIFRGVTRGLGWHYFSHSGRPISIRKTPILRVSPHIVTQILSQSRHDTAVLAPGALALPNIRVFDATDLTIRDGINVSAVFDGMREQPVAVVIMPFLLIGGAEKYAADLVDALLVNNFGPVLVLITDQSAEEAAGWEDLAILSPLQRAEIMFWRDACGGFGYSSPVALARFLNAVRPRLLVVINCRVGLEAVARFGRGISQFGRIACCFFSMGVQALGAPYGARYPRRIMPFALAVTDNDPMANQLRYLHGEIPGSQVIVIPPRVYPVSETDFARRLAAQRKRTSTLGQGFRWAWVSRIEPFKGTALLVALAAARPEDRFDVFGSVHPSGTKGMDLPNIVLHPPLLNVLTADFGDYDGFLFTSLFEGMPNVVLEMSQQAVPMVLADVGGLRQTFDDKAVVFVSHARRQVETVVAFSQALDRVGAMGKHAISEMVTAARLQVSARHAPEVHVRNVAATLLSELTPCR